VIERVARRRTLEYPGRRADRGDIDGDAVSVDLLLDPGDEARGRGKLVVHRERVRQPVALAERGGEGIVGLGLDDHVPIGERALLLGAIDECRNARLLLSRGPLKGRRLLRGGCCSAAAEQQGEQGTAKAHGVLPGIASVRRRSLLEW